MKNVFQILLLIILFQTAITSQAQNRKDRREQSKHRSSFEDKTLTNSQLPIMMPYNRWIDPAGLQIYFGDKEQENHALDCALSPDEKWIAVEGRYSIVIISTENNKIVNRTTLQNLLPGESAMNTFTGIKWRKTGKNNELWWSASAKEGKSYVIKAEWDGNEIKVLDKFVFDAEKPATTALPNEIAIIEEAGTPMFYVVLNGHNQLVKRNAITGEIIWKVPTGVAPFGIATTGGKIYVTNWAGSQPDADDKNVAGVPWGNAKVDPKTGATREGTVSLFNPADGKLLKEITVGLHPNDIITSPDGNYIFVANANSDEVSVIETKTDAVCENISVRLGEEKNPFWGDSPNGLGIYFEYPRSFDHGGGGDVCLSRPSQTD